MIRTKITLATAAFLTLSGVGVADESIEIGKKIYERAFGRGCGTCHDISSNPN